MIGFENAGFAYEAGRPVLEGLTFSIAKGESVGLIGANGTGKSTLMKMLVGLLPHTGSVRVDGLEVERANLAEVRRRVGCVLQDSDDQMFMPTVLEDMVFGPLNQGLSRREAEARADGVLRELGIEALRDRYNHRISGGEKRMAAIATILAMRPQVVLMDEPSTALDPLNRRAVIRTINRIGQTKLIASHDLDMILDTCERVILLSGGRIAADGPADGILRDRALLERNRMELPLCLQHR